ncbi:MAG: ornithine cyclodeaminase [Chloroflexi bacterium RBG_16_51_16]|nr:MAG: ornithine cyclodeaminase [Chloroflexi bacterium RBG_16_51_16]
MLILSADDVRKALPMKQAIDAMKSAYAALSAGNAEIPLRTRISIPTQNATSLFMPAYVHTPDTEALAVKVVSLFPENPAKGLEFIQAAVLVLDAGTGRSIAILEGSSLTAIRTGAGSGAAIDLLARKEAETVAIFGAGAQGRTQLEAACTVRKIKTVWIFDNDRKKAEEFAGTMAGRGPIPSEIKSAPTSKQAIEEADIICTATTSQEPVFNDTFLKPGTHISAIGSYTPEMQEIPAETIKRAKVFVDSRLAVLAESGDLIKSIKSGLITEGHIKAELGEVYAGSKPGRQSGSEITYFKSVGVAVQDAMAADLAVRNARTLNLGQEINF